MSLWVATDHDLLTLYFKLMTFHKLHALRFWELEWHETKTTEILVGGNFFFFIDAKLLPYILTTVNHRCPSFPEGRGGGGVHTQAIWMPRYLMLFFSSILHIISFYYINTNEIPGELSHKNLISSHVKITCYLHMWKYHLCYGYIINRAFHTKKLLKWNGLVVHWCLYNK